MDDLWRAWWPLDVAAAAARMVLWVALLRVAAAWALRRAPGDRVARVAWGAVGLQVAALLLWRVGPVEVALLLGVGLAAALGTGLGWRGRARRPPWERAWLRAVDLFHDPSPPSDAAAAGSLPLRHDVAVVLRALVAGGRRVLEPAAAVHRGGASRTRRRRRLTLAAAGGAAVAVAVARALRDHPLGPGDVALLLAGENLAPATEHSFAALADVRLAARLAGAAPVVAAAALAAPIVAVAAWSGVGLVRRLAPRAPPWWGAAAGALVPACALLAGHPATPDLAVGALVPWAVVGPDARGRGAWRPVAVAAALVLLSPAAALFALLGALAGQVARGAAAGNTRRATALTLALAAAVVLATWTGVFDPAVAVDPAVRLRHQGVEALAALLGAWMTAWRPRGRVGPVAVYGRAMGLVLLVGAALASPPGNDPGAGLPATTLATLVTLGCAVVASDLLRERALRPWATVGAAALVLPLAWCALPPAPAGGLPRSAAEVAQALRARHRAGTYAVLGPREARPAFTGQAGFAECALVRGGREGGWRPAVAAPAAPHRYVLVAPGRRGACEWVEEIARAEARPTPAGPARPPPAAPPPSPPPRAERTWASVDPP